jgi:MFS family permease
VQGAGGGIFPLAFGIIRDEFPREKVAGSIGLMSALLGIGGGVGIVVGALIVEHLSWHWLFWLPLPVIVAAAAATWRFVPESPVRVEGRINWLAAVLMSAGMTLFLVAISETTAWGWGSARTLLLLAAGALVCVTWIVVEVRSSQPLIDMALMRVRAVWTANLTAFLLGAGMYSSFVVFPQFAQLPKSTGFGFGASVLGSALYLLPSTGGMFVVGSAAGRIAARFGSKAALVAGSAITAVSFGLLAVQHGHVYDFLVSSALLGVGIGLAFAALGNIVVQAVDEHQTGVASGMNTVMRTVGGALGGQLTATFLAEHVRAGLPTVTGFVDGFVLSTCFLVVCTLAALLVPGRGSRQYVERFEEVAAAD